MKVRYCCSLIPLSLTERVDIEMLFLNVVGTKIILISLDELKWKMDSDVCEELGLWALGLEKYNNNKKNIQSNRYCFVLKEKF